ncbi:MAG: Rrf2 family transcriptional regulator [Actinomycetota bacterium]
MPVTLGKHGDYAVRAALDLARHRDGEPRKAREIAAAMDIPTGFLKRILAELVSQGLLTSTAGPNGGYRLIRPPEDITVLDIIEPTERLLSPDKCILRGGPCEWSDVCPIHDLWCLAQKAFADSLDATTLAQLARIDHDIEHDAHTPINALHTNQTPRRGIRT